MATTTGQVRPVRFDPPENVLSHHPHSPILMKGSTWTISLTPGVRRSAAPMMVVMASWIDSREYTFLMNPEVSHYVILMPAQLFNRSIKRYQISELPAHLCN